MIINTIPTTQCQPQTIVIGRRGTYDTMQIAFDLSYLVESFGNGVAVLAVKRSQDESAYPAVVTQEDNTLTWTVSETDTAYVGAGECQLMWYVDGGLAKTIIYPMVVMRDILATSEDAPDAYPNWIESLTALGAETLQNAQDAAQSASDAEDAKDDTVTAKEAAEAAQQAAETAVTHYPKIENNYWMVWDSTSQSYVSTGIQAEGEDGYSPEVTITSIDGGHRVTITDKDHPQGQSFDVMDGQGGGGGTSDYTGLTNKPQINGHTLTGNQTAAQLGLATPSDIPTVPVQSVNGKTGAVVLSATDVDAKPASYTAPVSSVNGKTGAVSLDSGDIGFDSAQTYQAGSVGAELQEQNRQLSDKQNAPSTAGTAGQVLGLDSNLDPVWVNQSGGGSTQQMELIKLVELDSDAQSVVIDTDYRSEPFVLNNFVIIIKSVGAVGATSEGYLKVALNSNVNNINRIADISGGIRKENNMASVCGVAFNFTFGCCGYFIRSGANLINDDGTIPGQAYGDPMFPFASGQSDIEKVFVGSNSESQLLGAGSIIALYGQRK